MNTVSNTGNSLNSITISSNLTGGFSGWGTVGQVCCSTCGTWYFPGALYGHQCVSNYHFQNINICSVCGSGYYGNLHTCTGVVGTTTNFTYPSITTYADITEITTDEKLEYYWNGSNFSMKIPAKFTDCFLKIGYKYSPLYPLIFSARMNNESELSFHLVADITDKSFEGDFVILHAVTTTKIDDNLTLLQLSECTRNYFKKDENVTPH